MQNLTDIYFYTKPCFPANSTFLHILMYVMNDYEDNPQCDVNESTGLHCPDQRNSGTYAFVALWIIIMLVAVFGNISVCYVIYNSRALSSLVANRFIASLAVSDLLVGVLLVPVRIYSTIRTGGFCLSRRLCHYYMTMDNVCFVASITNLLVITTDRIIAIDWPYAHQDIVTKTRSKIAIIIVWAYAAMMGGLANVKWESRPANTPENVCWTQNKGYITFVFTTVFYVPALIMGVSQARMLVIALRHSKDIVSAMPLQSLSSDTHEERDHNSKRPSKQIVTRIKKALKEYHAVQMIMVVYGTFVACWIPVSIIALFHVWCPNCAKLKQWHIAVFVELLPILNSTLNFFIYSVMNREFRKAFKRLCKKAYIWCSNDIG